MPWFGLAIALLVGVAGCSYRGHRGGDVFDAATAKALLGTDARIKLNVDRGAGMSQCEWDGANGAVTVWVGNWDDVETGFSSEKPVANLGDEAWSDHSEIYVRKGNAGLGVMAMVMKASGMVALPVENLKVAKLLVSHL